MKMATDAEMSISISDDSSTSPQHVQHQGDRVINDLACEYSEYMKFDVSNEKHQFEDSVEGMLSRLDEYCGLVDAIRSDTTLCLQKTMPEICRTSADLETIFQRIDALEAFVGMVKQNLNELDELVNRAEEDMGQFSSIKKMFTSIPSFLTKKPSAKTSPSKSPKFVPIEIFQTEEYLKTTPHKEAAASTCSSGTSDVTRTNESSHVTDSMHAGISNQQLPKNIESEEKNAEVVDSNDMDREKKSDTQ